MSLLRVLLAAFILFSSESSAPGQPSLTDPPKSETPKTESKVDWPREIQGKSLSLWINDLNNADPGVREAAVRIIPHFGPVAKKPALKPILSKLSDSDPGVRLTAVMALQTLGFESKEDVHNAANKLLDLMDNKTSSGNLIRLQIFRTLAALGPEAHVALKPVMKAAQDSNWETRVAAVLAIGRLGAPLYDDKAPAGTPAAIKRPPSVEAMSKLISMLNDPSAAVRVEICKSLMWMGPPVAEKNEYTAVVSPLIDGIHAKLKGNEKEKPEKEASVKLWLLLALSKYDDHETEAAVDKLAFALADSELPLRHHALAAIPYLVKPPQKIINGLRDNLKSDDVLLVGSTIDSITLLGENGKVLIPDLETLNSTTKNEQVKIYSKKALDLMKSMGKK